MSENKFIYNKIKEFLSGKTSFPDLLKNDFKAHYCLVNFVTPSDLSHEAKIGTDVYRGYLSAYSDLTTYDSPLNKFDRFIHYLYAGIDYSRTDGLKKDLDNFMRNFSVDRFSAFLIIRLLHQDYDFLYPLKDIPISSIESVMIKRGVL